MGRNTPPPRFACRLIAGLADDLERDTLLGDLDEGFAIRARRDGPAPARRWYRRQAFILMVGLTWIRVRQTVAPGALTLDLRRAVRSLVRSPALTLAGVVAMGIGVAAPTSAFGIIDAMFSKLPVERPEEVVAIDLVDRDSGDRFDPSFPVFEQWDELSSSFAGMGAYDGHEQAVSGPGFAPVRIETAEVTPGVFTVLGAAPLIGRTIQDEDMAPGATPAALIREDLWKEWFDADSGALGAEIRVGEGHFVIVGVMPEDFGFPESHLVWTAVQVPVPDEQGFGVVARLNIDTPVARARAEITTLLAGIAGSTSDSVLARTAVTMDEYVLAYHGRRTRTLLWALNLLVGLLVVIAAANVSALILARGTTRAAETALRMSIGGSRSAVVRPLVLEALMISAVGTTEGLGLSLLVTRWLAVTLESRANLPYWADFGLSVPILLFASALMLGATFVAGVIPAIRTSRLDLPQVMKAGRTAGTSGRVGGLSTLVGLEVALACLLLLLSTFVVQSALGMVQRLGGFPTEGVLTAELVLEPYDYPDVEARRGFWQDLERGLNADPQVATFTVASALPGDGTSDAWIAIEGRTYEKEQDWPRAQRRVVDHRFFSMFGMSALSGRTFGAGDGDESPPMAVVNEAFVQEHMGRDGDAGGVVGRRILIREWDGEAVAHEIVGLVSDPGVSVDDGQRVAAVFIPTSQRWPAAARVALRLQGGPMSGPGALRILSASVHDIDPALPLDWVMTMEEVVRRENDGGRIMGTLFGLLGAAAFLLAIVGLHGVVAFSTARRTYEIGVKRALGAPDKGVISETVRRGLRPVAVGLVLGLAASWLLTPILGQEMLENVGGAHSPTIFTIVPVVLLAAAAVAVLGPARRACRVNPVSALRSD